jgi:hypothetical protein
MYQLKPGGNKSTNNRETMEAVFSVWSVPRLYKELALSGQFSLGANS